jgi:hypothetical protein
MNESSGKRNNLQKQKLDEYEKMRTQLHRIPVAESQFPG